MCPTVCCGTFLHYTHPRLACGLIQIWQPTNWKGFRAFCIPKHLMRMLQLGHPRLLGKGIRSNLAALQRKHWWQTWLEGAQWKAV